MESLDVVGVLRVARNIDVLEGVEIRAIVALVRVELDAVILLRAEIADELVTVPREPNGVSEVGVADRVAHAGELGPVRVDAARRVLPGAA